MTHKTKAQADAIALDCSTSFSSPKCPSCGMESCATDRFPHCVGCGLDIFAENERNRKESALRMAARRSPAYYRLGNPYGRTSTGG